MSDLLDRKVKLVIAVPAPPGDYGLGKFASDVTEIENLRVKFTVTKTASSEPNTAEIYVYNLAKNSRTRFERDGKILLMAGYAETIDTVFVGDIRQCDSKLDSVTWETKITSGDGERATRGAHLNQTLPPGIGIPEVVGVAMEKMGAPKLKLPDLGSIKGSYSQGITLFGPAAKELDRVLKDQGYEWSIQDNEIVVRKPGEPNLEEVVYLSQATGLLGIPEMGTPEKKGGKPCVKIRSLLQPSIRIGRRVQVVSEKLNGLVVPRKITHTGDTDGGDWFTEFEATLWSEPTPVNTSAAARKAIKADLDGRIKLYGNAVRLSGFRDIMLKQGYRAADIDAVIKQAVREGRGRP